jgi:SAM-dependent methyltransferase
MKESIFTTISRMGKKYGLFQTIRFGSSVILQFIFLSKFYKSQKFYFDNKEYNYFINFLNGTHTNERIIEIPLIIEVIKANKGKRILEIGNVISKYYNFPHDIVDKYEKDENVINQDVTDYFTSEKYDFIFSISTMEHVGYDESPLEPEKILKAFKNLKSLLNPGGNLVVTMPLGYNQYLDKFLKEGKFGFNQEFYFKKNKKFNTWKEIGEINNDAKYEENFPPHANDLVLAIISKNN